jgi:hypothetical protein
MAWFEEDEEDEVVSVSTPIGTKVSICCSSHGLTGSTGTVLTSHCEAMPCSAQVQLDDGRKFWISRGDLTRVKEDEFAPPVATDEATHDPSHGPQQWHPENW